MSEFDGMTRRGMVAGLGVAGAGLLLGQAPSLAAAPSPRPSLAITIDDFAIADGPLLSGEQKHVAILDTLDRHGVKAAGFPAGKYIDGPIGRRHLASWAERGHAVGCHSYDHAYYSDDAGSFVGDLDRALPLVSGYATSVPLFRFPFLAEGSTALARDAARAALRGRGLSNAHVTIDTSDWYIAGRLVERLRRDPSANLGPFRRYYLAHLLDRAGFYDQLARQVLDRRVPHTILLHHNLATALFLDDAIRAFRRRGWQIVNARHAFADPVFRQQPMIVPAGQSLVWQLAKEHGGYDRVLRSPGEDGDYEKPAMDKLGL